MRVIIQRVSRASVTVEGRVIGRIGAGLLALVGLAPGDGAEQIDAMADKMINLRIFADGEGKMNLSLLDTGGAVLAVSQFTLHADCRRGRRPSFMGAAPPDVAAPLMEAFVEKLRACGVVVETGQFGAMMEVELVNDGPVTIILDSDELGIR